MSSEIDELRAEIRYVKDRLDILDCVNNQSRGHDRHDVELMTSVYHPDGVDEHGPDVLLGPEYGTWANRQHASVFGDHLHNLTTHTCEIDGDVAHAESYVFGSMVGRDGKTLVFLGGRYLDRLERRDGVWKIALRRCTMEWAFTADASFMRSSAFKGFLKGSWNTDDLSYARPLVPDSEPAVRW
ncbi:nuclear transport factor 2 family protein [Yinghuangia sp. ASG 101]|uniref:nuclear transport factor 2 family protein n=1 Tax=Yinghuangia sp. ASG 101 TaxID=2896848 RepID=UPI001E54638F|nr:nuclear transport factor 2 family protein [Yinghuangia sp. ASG 101]UGQ10981.1 nuclear transport factor 2 family protein [Yinghuangia sp. ASG 101]